MFQAISGAELFSLDVIEVLLGAGVSAVYGAASELLAVMSLTNKCVLQLSTHMPTPTATQQHLLGQVSIQLGSS